MSQVQNFAENFLLVNPALLTRMTATDTRCHSVVPLSYKFARPSSRLRIGVIGRASRIRDADSVRSPPYLHAARGRAATEDTRSPKFEMVSSRFARLPIFDVCDCLQLWNSFLVFSPLQGEFRSLLSAKEL